MSHSLKNQLQQAIIACFAPGQSRHSAKHSGTGEADYKIYSYNYKDDLLKTSASLAGYIQDHYPDTKMVRDIKPWMLQAYLQDKADAGASASYLANIKSQVNKLESACQHKYSGIKWHTDLVHTPDADRAERVRVLSMDDRLYQRLLAAMPADTQTYKSLVLSHAAGLRVRETGNVHLECISLRGGKYGYGSVTLRPGGIDGAKHGKPRVIDILTSQDRDDIRDICKGVKPGQTIISKADGRPYQTGSITRAIARACDSLGISPDWLQNKNHALRKTFAQRCYDTVRRETIAAGWGEKESRQAAAEYVMSQLGHGADRKELLSTYVHMLW